jgi:hypothetical protein
MWLAVLFLHVWGQLVRSEGRKGAVWKVGVEKGIHMAWALLPCTVLAGILDLCGIGDFAIPIVRYHIGEQWPQQGILGLLLRVLSC